MSEDVVISILVYDHDFIFMININTSPFYHGSHCNKTAFIQRKKFPRILYLETDQIRGKLLAKRFDLVKACTIFECFEHFSNAEDFFVLRIFKAPKPLDMCVCLIRPFIKNLKISCWDLTCFDVLKNKRILSHWCFGKARRCVRTENIPEKHWSST